MEEAFYLRLYVIFGCFVSGGRGKGRRSGPSPVPLLLWRNGDLTLEQRHLYRSGSWETKLFGETLSAIGIFKQALQITIDSIGTSENAVSWLGWIELKRTWEMNPHLPPCCYTRLWIIRESLSVRGTRLEIWEIGSNFQGFESWNIRWGQNNTRQLRLPEWTQPKQARRWLARFYFIQKIFTLNLLTHYLFLCEWTIATVAMTTPAPRIKWLLWQPLFTFGLLLIFYQPGLGCHGNHFHHSTKP